MLKPSEGMLKKLSPNRMKSNTLKSKKNRHPILGGKHSSSNKVVTPKERLKDLPK